MFKSLFTEWSLEKKCLFFLGLALLFSLVLGSVAVQWVAERLVSETIRQSARDYADKVKVNWHKHILKWTNKKVKSQILKSAHTERSILMQTFFKRYMLGDFFLVF